MGEKNSVKGKVAEIQRKKYYNVKREEIKNDEKREEKQKRGQKSKRRINKMSREEMTE